MIDIPYESKNDGFQYDSEWLAIVRASQKFFSTSREQISLPHESMEFLEYISFDRFLL